MSFKQFSKAQDAPSQDTSGDKPKVAPAAVQPIDQADTTADEVGPPAPKP